MANAENLRLVTLKLATFKFAILNADQKVELGTCPEPVECTKARSLVILDVTEGGVRDLLYLSFNIGA